MSFLAIGHGILLAKGIITADTYVIELVFAGITCVLASRVTAMLVRNSNDNIETSRQVVHLAETLNDKFEQAKEVSQTLNEQVELSHTSVAEIADSIRTMAESIEQQTAKTVDIQGSNRAVGQEASTMRDISVHTSQTVDEGVTLIERLKVQATEVEKINIETKNTTE